MRKLNRKGFTLVELLAVIVILAIVVGIALTTVLPTLKKSRLEAFSLTPNTAADYLEKQYQLSLIGEVDGVPNGKMQPADFAKAGLKAENYHSGNWYIVPETGRACVTLIAATNNNLKAEYATQTKAGQYYDVDLDSKGNVIAGGDTKQSDGCYSSTSTSTETTNP